MKRLIYDEKNDFILLLKMGDEYCMLEKESVEWTHELKKSLSTEQSELFDKILCRQSELQTYAIRTAYSDGIKFALTLSSK